jgi:hypothetical protein
MKDTLTKPGLKTTKTFIKPTKGKIEVGCEKPLARQYITVSLLIYSLEQPYN